MDWKPALTQVNSVELLEPLSVYRQEGHTIRALLHVNSLRGEKREGNIGIGGFLLPFNIVMSVFTECGFSVVLVS